MTFGKLAGVVNIAHSGRIILPAELRRELGWELGDQLETTYSIADGSVMLKLKRKHTDLRCSVCRNEPLDRASYLDSQTNMAVCQDCAIKISKGLEAEA